MTRRPPRSTRTDTLFPYTTLFRSLNIRRKLQGDRASDTLYAVCALAHSLAEDGRKPEATKILADVLGAWQGGARSEEHTSELQSLMRISYAVFCLKKNNKTQKNKHQIVIHKRTKPHKI